MIGPAEDGATHRWMAGAVMAVVILLFAGIRWRLREMPLERDEGEYAYAGQLLLQGIPPYQLAYNMKLPGTYVAYAVILKIFGQTPAGVHIGLLVVNACTTLLIFFAGRRLCGELGGVTAGMSYALLSASETVMGLSGHATHFVALMAVAGGLLLLKARESEKLLWFGAAGLCMGTAFVMKQPGIVFVLFGAQEIAWRCRKRKAGARGLIQRLGTYLLGAAAPYLLTCVALYKAGVFVKFWFWTVQYARQYGAATSLRQGMEYLGSVGPKIFLAAPVLWCFAAAGVIAVVVKERLHGALSLEISFLIWSFVGVSAGLYYREHYFILLLPAVSLLAGRAMQGCVELIRSKVAMQWLTALPVLLFAIGYAASLYAQRQDFFERRPEEVVRQRYGGNPFPEALQFGKYVEGHSGPDATIAVFGSEPEIYFYAKRHSATGHIYMYGLMEEQPYASQMQREMRQEVEQAKPEYIVKVMVTGSWLRKAHSDPGILEWGERYLADGYKAVGEADIGLATTYRWGQDAETYVPRSRYSMYLYKRKD